MATSSLAPKNNNVIDLFTRRPYKPEKSLRFIRLAPELDGLEMLYSNEMHAPKLFSVKILCWALREDGEVVGMIPWLDRLMPCPDIQDPLNGQWQGYFDPGTDEIFFEAPIHKALELETAVDYYDYACEHDTDVIQEIPDTIGTHAVFSNDKFKTLSLKSVISWRLFHSGGIHGLVIDDDRVVETPVLPGDEGLYTSETHPDFHYYFQHSIANKIKAGDPDALAAISMLTET
jgi:hypothetical protein